MLYTFSCALLFLDGNHSNWGEVKPHWRFYLYFLDGEWSWAFFHAFLTVCISSFEKYLWTLLAYLLNCKVDVEFLELLYIFWILILHQTHNLHNCFLHSFSCLFVIFFLRCVEAPWCYIIPFVFAFLVYVSRVLCKKSAEANALQQCLSFPLVIWGFQVLDLGTWCTWDFCRGSSI